MPSDWFSDTEASQWGYYSARLRAAARLAPSKDVVYGGYIVSRTTISFRLQAFLSTWQQRSCEQVPRAGGQLPDGLLMKMMAIVGSGGKALKFYVFGPECQCDRFRPRLFQKL